MSHQTFHQLGIKAEFTKPAAQHKSYSGHVIDVRGVTILPCEYKGKLYQIKFYIVDLELPAVLGASTCTEMGLVRRIHTVNSLPTKAPQYQQHKVTHLTTSRTPEIRNRRHFLTYFKNMMYSKVSVVYLENMRSRSTGSAVWS